MTPTDTVTVRYLRAFRSGGQDRADAPELRRRRLVVVVITLVVGVAVNAWALRIPAGQWEFFPATALLALVWFAGAFASGPIRLGGEPHRPDRRPVVSSLLIAAALATLFCAGALVVAQIPFLRDPVQNLLGHAAGPDLALVVLIAAINGVAEECFHRGAVYSAAQRYRPVAVSAVVYALVVMTSGVPLLILAAVVLGVVTAAQRRCTGGVLGPCVTHVAWSLVMLVALGPILGSAGAS